ncbi:2-dehydropantoate 2-reductase [Colwellia sp. E2M01]|uniref:ketopantoate reductase family protein n=1 Tax=Colwellia sp. E2M01 TaxID=2841561 RepID=UPI001C09AD1C|nr:2-dehydropantoate 2-reductase [Colwellia sp. E2M01]MBU2869279.1 2-dehydropantoate 2-reductase [Colwellia sp. E2M01]
MTNQTSTLSVIPFSNIVVVGQGAIGLLWYHHLSQAKFSFKNSVTLLTSKQGLTHKNKNVGQAHLTNYHFTSYQEIPSEKVQGKSYPLRYSETADIAIADIILLCVKSYQIAAAIKNIAKQLSPNCIIILAHNGMGAVEEVVNLLPKSQRILTMLTTHGSLRNSPLNITHTGLGRSDIGQVNRRLADELTAIEQQQLTALLNTALPSVTFHQDIIEKQWLKLAINCVINPITAINGLDNGEVNNEQFSEQVNYILAEIVAVSKAEEINLSLAELQEIVRNVAKATAQNCSSMRCDVLAGKSTEIDYINGYIHRLGEKHNIATPENTRMWQAVKSLSEYQ